MSDELAPISGGRKDPFGGWAATLVDALDTLWLMDMRVEFLEAVEAAVSIDFGTSSLKEINVFETTIRYLGGFIAAYDLSGDERLLVKAIELGDMLLVAFDTPNRLPVTRWNVRNAANLELQIAHDSTLVAEIGSLTMEFTRLSQITKDPRWYDATDRIMRVFDEQQNKTYLPGMWPVVVDARTSNFTRHTGFSLGAMSDSLYEYFPKMYALLGCVEPMYRKLYEESMSTAIKHNLWRPMTPDNADILISGNADVDEHGAERLEHQGQHLVCFAGGMFALGGRLFDLPEHLEVGRKLTEGCIWTYKQLPLGIMPEVFEMSACPSKDGCEWDERKWKGDIFKKDDSPPPGADDFIKTNNLVPGFTNYQDKRYMLRPEAIESVFILYRVTGREDLLTSAWDMFQAIQENTKTDLANGALGDVTTKNGKLSVMNSMESFWLSETLKYFYLIFSEPSLISLDEYVFNTEAHPLRRPK